MAKNLARNTTNPVVPESLTLPHKSDYRRGWMIRNERTKGVTITTEQLAFLLVTLRHRDGDLIREVLGEQTCDAVLDKHTAKTDDR